MGRPQENGDCESANGHLKRRIRQHLLLRGSRDFSNEEEYDRFLIGVLESANRLRAKRLGEDLAAMRETEIADLPDFREVMVSVGNNSTIRVRKQSYSVPSRLIGTKLLARIYENRIVLLAGAQEVAQLPLGGGDRGAVIDFRHVIGHLLRKPGAFAGYRWREEMFPAPVYRATYDHLTRIGHDADRRYLEILKVAADEGQTVVAARRTSWRPWAGNSSCATPHYWALNIIGRHRVCAAKPGRNGGALHAVGRALRAAESLDQVESPPDSSLSGQDKSGPSPTIPPTEMACRGKSAPPGGSSPALPWPRRWH